MRLDAVIFIHASEPTRFIKIRNSVRFQCNYERLGVAHRHKPLILFHCFTLFSAALSPLQNDILIDFGQKISTPLNYFDLFTPIDRHISQQPPRSNTAIPDIADWRRAPFEMYSPLLTTLKIARRDGRAELLHAEVTAYAYFPDALNGLRCHFVH